MRLGGVERLPRGWAPAASHLAGLPPVLSAPRPRPPSAVLTLALGRQRSAYVPGTGAGVSEMGPEDSHRRGQATALGPPGDPGSDGLWPPGPRPARGSKSVNRQEEAHAARPRPEDLRRPQAHAWQRTVPRGSSGRPRAEAGPEAEAEAPRDPPGAAHVGTALAGLRAELLEMHFPNHQLAKTLLDLNKKMQRLKKEYELEIASESQSSEHNVGNLE
ncbi:alanine and arginine-rich domain-containing protein [Enhydra lutris kenyoni]|uniref:Alanine and arginine-rich domain-containing protein n=1 Tax=Enhydra lutris kenyoni TaxID=391180 RepID=A0A2Y9JDI9_ENHLU|nr:alanine and arginine-rich domain-containing protein [Enhydra lutris kenyoni]